MSRYVQHQHGMVIGSGNIFFVVDRGEEHHPPVELPKGVPEFRGGYRAIVLFQDYEFDQMDSLNVNLRTPAEQLVFEVGLVRWSKEMQLGDREKPLILPMVTRHPQLRLHWHKWLADHVGLLHEDWDAYTRPSRTGKVLFFKRRRDALALVQEVQRRLSGLRIG